MGMITKAILVAVLGVGAWLWFKGCCPNNTPPRFDPDEWWGPKNMMSKQDKNIRPFKVKFEESMILDLKQRLKNHRSFRPPLEGVAFEYGFNTAQLDSWLKYWADDYKFSEREAFLNKLPQFKTNIQGLDIHFIRVITPQVPAGVEVVPILLMHGWPGSVREFYEAIPLLTKYNSAYDFAFEVIVPSIPGYGFSDAAVRPGLSAPKVAVIFRNLMNRLGHKKFYIQGGDWGAAIADALATLYPDEVLGHHSNMLFIPTSCGMMKILIGAFFPSLIMDSSLADRLYPLSSTIAYALEEFGYMHLQATKPDTIGVSLSDSPAGLMAYILEKFSSWTRKDHKFKHDGGLNYRYTKDQLIDNLMYYWSTNSITTSMRLYSETLNKKSMEASLNKYPSPVPTWAFQAKHEIFYNPPSVIRPKYPNLLNTTVSDDGGHFLAFELPHVFVQDVFRAVKAFREWHKHNKKTEL